VKYAVQLLVLAMAVVPLRRADEPVPAPKFESTRLLENDLVTVTHARYPAGATSEMHAHGDRVNVFLTDLAVHVTTGEGEEFEATREVGTAVWSEATSHALRAISDFEVVVVELRGDARGKPVSASSQDATSVDAPHHEIEFENDRVRIVRVKLAPGERTPSHVHSLPAVTVLLGEAQIRVTDDAGQSRVIDRHHGEARWMDPVGQHIVENVGKTELIAIRVEIKQTPA
jgi:quercetin dioxygenase-like cupin family protein